MSEQLSATTGNASGPVEPDGSPSKEDVRWTIRRLLVAYGREELTLSELLEAIDAARTFGVLQPPLI